MLLFLTINPRPSKAHIATVGKAMSSSEEVSYPILKKHDVSYVLVIFGGLLGYSGCVPLSLTSSSVMPSLLS